MPSRRHPFKQTPRDTRAHTLIEHHLNRYGLNTGDETAVRFEQDGYDNHAAANQGRLSIRRGARHYDVSAAARVTDQDGQQCVYDCADPAAPHALVFSLWSKDHGRAHVFRQSGGDPAALKYVPYGRRT
jgi:hypothetical protein